MTNCKSSKLPAIFLLALSIILTLALLMSHYAGIIANRGERFDIQLTNEAKLNVEIITIGNKNAVLVPEKRVADDKVEIEEIIFLVNVELTGIKLSEDQNFILTIESNNVTIDGKTRYSELLNFSFVKDYIPLTDTYISTSEAVSLGVIVTLDEPSNEQVYNEINGKVINFTLTLNAVPNF